MGKTLLLWHSRLSKCVSIRSFTTMNPIIKDSKSINWLILYWLLVQMGMRLKMMYWIYFVALIINILFKISFNLTLDLFIHHWKIYHFYLYKNQTLFKCPMSSNLFLVKLKQHITTRYRSLTNSPADEC